uniref:type II toxin-antitoxin system PemK/MazF family toxin n=1 Tax=Streptobacillus moniliformis TaxID=34105 RepID=UPI000A64A78C
MTEFKQLDIYWVDLEPTKGAETQKPRPCVIIQSDLVNIQSKTVIVAPLLPNHKTWPFAVNLTPTN